jgi:hypothetical protein
MARQHYIQPTGPSEESITVRLGASASAYTQKEEGKIVKLAAESQYNLAVAGDEIEGIVTSVESATQNQFTIAGVSVEFDQAYVVFDGLQATPGTGVVAIGDYVVAGSITPAGTALTTYPKVCKATAAGNTLNHKFRVVSLGSAGTGAVGTQGVIQRVC